MGKTFSEIDERNAEFIRAQRMFFVATAPRADEGRVNLSPKGLESLALLGPTTVAYLDLVGSGAETIAHLRENGRITFLFCAFEGPPRLLRLYGRGRVIEPGDSEWNDLTGHFPNHPGQRAIIHVEVERIADSCGYGVPRYDFVAERKQLFQWAEKRGAEGIERYQAENNTESIDGLPALRRFEEKT